MVGLSRWDTGAQMQAINLLFPLEEPGAYMMFGSWTLRKKFSSVTAPRLVGSASQMNTASAFCQLWLSPLADLSQVPLSVLGMHLIQLFQHWGMPSAIKMDRGLPFGMPSGVFYSRLYLWLCGLGVEGIINRAKTPTDNAKVERSHGVLANWVELKKIYSFEELTLKLPRQVLIQRDKYPTKITGGKSRREYFKLYPHPIPQLIPPFDIQKIYERIKPGHWGRTCSERGQVHFLGQRWGLGTAWKHRAVQITLDVNKAKWIITQDETGQVKQVEAEPTILKYLNKLVPLSQNVQQQME